MSGFVFNTRRPTFADIRVRRALAELFDFEWVNKNLYYGAYVRAASYFNDSELSAIGRPADEREKKLLAPFPDAVAPDVMAGTYKPVVSDGSGGDRKVLRAGPRRAAGRRLRAPRQRPRQQGDGRAARLRDPGHHHARTSAWRSPISARWSGSASRSTVRTVDAAQYQQRKQSFDYDMIRFTWAASLSPGNEQMNRWSVASADRNGSFNYPGAKQPAIDAMIAAMLAAPTREDFVAAVRALDRILISGTYVVPLFYLPEQWIAHWTRIDHPAKPALSGYSLPTWWAKTP